MPYPWKDYGAFLEELEERAKVLSEVMPYAQTLLLDWRYDLEAADGTTVGCFSHAWTRRTLMVSADARIFDWIEERVVESQRPACTIRAALPSQKEWLFLGGYEPGGALDGPSADDDLAF